MNERRIPAAIITGFLGSGKTTLLNRLLADPRYADAVVIVNELGEIGLDHLFIAHPVENVHLLASGCMCCTVRGEFAGTLERLLEDRDAGRIPPFSRVLIETTGLADPGPVIRSVAADAAVSRRCELDGVLTLVDAVNGERQLDEHREALQQAVCADRLLVTKTDIAEPARVEALEARLRAINPDAPVRRAVHGDVDPAEVFGGGLDAAARSGRIDRWLAVAPTAGVPGLGTSRHDGDILTFTLWHEPPVTRAGLVLWLDQLAGLRGRELLRMKGLVNVEGVPLAVHAVQQVIHDPVELPGWPDDDHRSRFVFITRNLDRARVERTFRAFSLALPGAVPGHGIDPAAYARFLEAARTFRS